MTRWLRFLITFVKAGFGNKIDLNSEQTIKLRTWFTDAELHYVNNSAILMYTELGRIDFLVRTGLLRWCLKNNVFAAFATAHISFRRSLKRFQKLELRSKLIYWDNDWLWIEQRIYCKIKNEWKLSCSLIVKATFKKARATIPFEEVIKTAGFPAEPKSKPIFIRELEVAEASSILK